jgi:prolyl-tRNA synthetase
VLELGERDIEGGVVTVTRRNDLDLAREQVPRSELASKLPQLVESMQAEYLAAAAERLGSRTSRDVSNADEFREFFSGDDPDSGGFVRAPWCADPATDAVMGELGVSVRCIPFDQALADGAECVISGAPAKVEALFAKAY